MSAPTVAPPRPTMRRQWWVLSARFIKPALRDGELITLIGGPAGFAAAFYIPFSKPWQHYVVGAASGIASSLGQYITPIIALEAVAIADVVGEVRRLTTDGANEAGALWILSLAGPPPSFTTRVTVSSDDEFHDLAGSFNSMTGKLSQQFHMLETISAISQAILSSHEPAAMVKIVQTRITETIACDDQLDDLMEIVGPPLAMSQAWLRDAAILAAGNPIAEQPAGVEPLADRARGDVADLRDFAGRLGLNFVHQLHCFDNANDRGGFDVAADAHKAFRRGRRRAIKSSDDGRSNDVQALIL